MMRWGHESKLMLSDNHKFGSFCSLENHLAAGTGSVCQFEVDRTVPGNLLNGPSSHCFTVNHGLFMFIWKRLFDHWWYVILKKRQVMTGLCRPKVGVGVGNVLSIARIKLCSTFANMGMDQYLLIHINTIFRGMNIHLPAILIFTRGTRFWHKFFNTK